MKACVLYSGGKDSSLMGIILKSLGFDVELVTANFGVYDSFHPAQKSAQSIGLKHKVLNLDISILERCVDMIMEDDAIPYFDEIEDDIISMKRDVNGFRIHVPAPKYMEYVRGTDTVNYRGKTFEYIVNDKVPDGPNLKRVSSWDEI